MHALILSLKASSKHLPRFDGVWTCSVFLLLLIWVFAPTQIGETLRFLLSSLIYMAPIVLVALSIAGSVRATGATSFVANVFSGRMTRMILIASLVGTVTPLCGVGVLPIIASLLAAGVPLAPVMAFWLSSPITSPAMFVITVGALGLPFAIAKSLSALVIGLLGGLITVYLQRKLGLFGSPLKTAPVQANADCGSGCNPSTLLFRFWREPQRRAVFAQEAKSSAALMLKWLTLAFIIESLVITYLPTELITAYVGESSVLAIPIAVAVGIPSYVDGYAALPLVRGLMELGMTPGAAMAFLVAGGITSLYASVAVVALVRLPVFLTYLGLAIAGSCAVGYVYQLIIG